MDFEAIEDAIIARLKRDMPWLRTVKTYAGELETEDLRTMTSSFPAAFVIYRGGSEEWVDGQTFNERPTFAVIFCSKNLRGNEKLRKDGDKGCYRMLKEGMATLTNESFGLAMERLTPTRKYLVFASASVAAYGIDFTTNFDTTY